MSTTPNQKDLLAKKSDLEGILKPDDNDVLHLPDVTITLAESGQFYLAGIDKKLLTLVGNTSGNAVALDGDAGLTFTTSGGSSTITGITSSSGNSTSLAASQSMASAKQDKIIAGTNIQIAQDGKTISATDTNELENLTDVNITTPTDGQGLVYNNTTQKWENGTVSSASSIDTLTDVNLTNLTNGQILKYNSTSQEWENANESGGGGSSVIPNPTGTPTDTLDTVSINGTIYEIQGSGGGGSTNGFVKLAEYSGSGQGYAAGDTITLSDDMTNYDMLVFATNMFASPNVYGVPAAFVTVDDFKTRYTERFFTWYEDTTGYNDVNYVSDTSIYVLRVSGVSFHAVYGVKFGGSGSGGGTGGVDTLWEGSVAPSVNNAIAVNLTHDIDDYDYILVNIKTTDQTYPYHSTCIYKPPFNINDLLLNLVDGNARLYCYLKINSLTNINLQAYDTQWGASTTYTGIYGVKTGGGGSSVTPNPQGTPTDTLSTLEIDGTIYNIKGGGGSVTTTEEIYKNTAGTIPDTINLTKPINDFDIILITGFRSNTPTWKISSFYVSSTINQGDVIELNDDAYYAWYTVTDLSTLTKNTVQYDVIDTIYGLKFGSGGGGSGDSFITYTKTVTTTNYGWWTVEDKDGNVLDPDEYIIVDISVTPYYYDVLWSTDSDGGNHYNATLININDVYEIRSSTTYDWTITYAKKDFSGGGGGSSVTPNPTDPATDTLTSIEIDGTVYSVGGEGSGYTEEVIYSATPSTAAPSTLTLTKPYTDFDMLLFNLYRSADGVMNKYDRVVLTSKLSLNDRIQLITYNEWASYDITTTTSFTLINENRMYIGSVVGLKFGQGSGGGGSSEVTYSTTEHKVGTWIDGSDVYEKTIVLRENGTDNYTYSSSVFAQCLPANINWINIESFYAKRGSGGWVDCMNNQQETILVPNPTTQGIYFYSQMSHTDIIVTIRYTKTI